MSSASLRARSPFFAFDSETGSRRPRWVAFVAGLISVVLGFAGVFVGVSAANAHDYGYEASCFGLTIKLTNYNSSKPNTVSVIIDGVEKVPSPTKDDFKSNYTATWKWDPATSHTYQITVDGWDGWDFAVPLTTQQPCAKPTVSLEATICNSTDGKTTLTAKASGFAAFTSGKNDAAYPSYKETYTGTLYRDGAVYKTVANVEAGPGLYTWPLEEAGHTYVWEVKGTTNGSLSATAQSIVVGCPQASGFTVTPNQCNATGSNNATVTVNAVVVPGRAYSVQVFKDGVTPYGGVYTIPASNTLAAYPAFQLSVPESTQNLTVVITDVAAAAGDKSKTRISTTFSTNPCPKDPGVPAVTADVCTVVGGSIALHVTFTGLVPGRAYDVFVNGAKVLDITPTTSTYPTTGTWDYPVTGGDYVVTITDELVPSATKSSPTTSVSACPTQPVVTLAVTECSVPGGKGSLTADLSGLAPNRSYLLSITENGNAMGAYPDVVIDSSVASKVFANLTPGATYNVTVIDQAATAVKGAASKTLKLCPDTPTITVTPRCDILTATTFYSVTLDKLQGGQQYSVTITTGGADALPPVTVTGGASGVAPTFQVPNGSYYTIAVTNVANPAITAAVDVFAAACDLPTFPLPPEFPELPTLALTGAADTTMPMLGALGLVQFGVALLALAAMLQFTPRRRLG